MMSSPVEPRGVRFAALLSVLALGGVLADRPAVQAQPVTEPQPPVRVLPTDRAYVERDPALFRLARKYFPGDQTGAPSKRLFRLTRDQIDSSVASLLPGYAPQSVKAAMARDPLQTNYEFAELLEFNAANLGALTGWIRAIAARVKEKPAGVIDCPVLTAPRPAADRAAASCLEAKARSFIVKAFRGDADADKVAKLVHFYTAGVQTVGHAQATSELVEVVLSSPHFLFRKELDVIAPRQAEAGTAVVKVAKGSEVPASGRLAPAQLLQALTYIIADSPPEKLMLSSQEPAQHLKSGPDARATIQAIVASDAARAKLARFFKAWLEIKEPGEFAISPKIFPEFTPKLAQAMVEETDRFLRAELAKPTPRLKDITQAAHSFVSRDLDAIYETKVKDPTGSKPVDLDPTKRFGIFSQPAVIASHSGPTDTRLVKRGAFWVRKLMCMEMSPPPKGLDITIYNARTTTERQRIEQATAQPACIGCHKVLDPFGFFQENYDAIGRWRAKEDNVHPIDAAIIIDFLDEKPQSTDGPVEALETLTNSAMFKQCFVRQLFRFYMGRQEEASDDPLLRRMFFEFADQDRQDILQALRMLAASDRIAMRQ